MPGSCNARELHGAAPAPCAVAIAIDALDRCTQGRAFKVCATTRGTPVRRKAESISPSHWRIVVRASRAEKIKRQARPKGRACSFRSYRSSDQGSQGRVLLEEVQILHPAVEPVNMARTLDNEVDEHTAIDEVVVDDQVVGVLDKWPVHVGEPVDRHK